MIPMVAGHSHYHASIPWQDRPSTAPQHEEDGGSVDSSRCTSRVGSPIQEEDEETSNGKTRTGGRFPRSKTMAGIEGGDGKGEENNAVQVVELKCEKDTESALLDLLGLRLSGSRSVGVFVQSIHAGSVADKDGRIKVGDQLINVESISLIGLTPDQVVRVLRSSFSYSTSSIRLTVAHQWANEEDRVPMAVLPQSQSEDAITLHSSTLTVPKPSTGIRRSSTPLAPLPGVLSGVPLVEVHRSSMGYPSRPHTQGATKITRPRQSINIDQNTMMSGGSDETLTPSCCDLREENSPGSNITPSSVSPATSTTGFNSILDMYDSTISDKSDRVVSALPPRSMTSSGRQSITDQGRPRIKSSPQITSTNDHPNLAIDKVPVTTLPGALVSATSIRRRRISQHKQTGEQSATRVSKGTNGNGRGGEEDTSQMRRWGSDQSLHRNEVEDRVDIEKSDAIKHFTGISTAVSRKSIRSMKTKLANDQVPLVTFDQLNRTSPSPTENNRRTTQSGSSGQSKSSKGSVSSQSSQKLSWQCPVCLDGASRIRRTRRRMMSTACGHVFCSSCVEDVVGKYHMCPTCRMPIRSMKDVHPIFM